MSLQLIWLHYIYANFQKCSFFFDIICAYWPTCSLYNFTSNKISFLCIRWALDIKFKKNCKIKSGNVIRNEKHTWEIKIGILLLSCVLFFFHRHIYLSHSCVEVKVKDEKNMTLCNENNFFVGSPILWMCVCVFVRCLWHVARTIKLFLFFFSSTIFQYKIFSRMFLYSFQFSAYKFNFFNIVEHNFDH
jgi:hypothetical protein